MLQADSCVGLVVCWRAWPWSGNRQEAAEPVLIRVTPAATNYNHWWRLGHQAFVMLKDEAVRRKSGI